MERKTLDLIELRFIEKKDGFAIMLDEKELHHVANYNIKQSHPPKTAILNLELLVKFPVQENMK